MRKTIAIMVCCISVCSVAVSANFDMWWPWIYRYVNVAKTNVISTDGLITISQGNHNVWVTLDTNVAYGSTNAWIWVTNNSNSINYMYSRTGLWDQAVVDASDWTNWYATNTILPYVYAHTSEWDEAYTWVNLNTNYIEARTSFWDEAYEWVNINSNTWDDIRVSLTTFKLGGVNDPGFAQWKTDGAGSQGIYLWWFDAAAEEEVFFAVQIPHDYEYGTDLEPHVHWVPSAAGGAGTKVSWGLEYCISEVGDTFPVNTTIISANTSIPNETPVAHRHYITSLPSISGAAINSLSAMIVCRIFRDAAGALQTDDYAADAGLMEFDLHYKKDATGSATGSTK